MTQVFDILAKGADSFMNLFRAGGETICRICNRYSTSINRTTCNNECNYKIYRG